MLLSDVLYAITTIGMVVTGLAMVGFSVRAHLETERQAFVYLALGFTFIVAATASTAISAFTLAFRPGQSLLLVNYAMSAIGYALVVYSLVAYRRDFSVEVSTTTQTVPGD